MRTALLTACGIVSLGGVAIVAMFFVLPEETLHAISGAVSFPHNDCPFCGMTRAFCAIVQGDFSRAMTLNRGSVPLFLFLSVTSVFFASVMFFFLKSELHKTLTKKKL